MLFMVNVHSLSVLHSLALELSQLFVLCTPCMYTHCDLVAFD
jgi:hypothetical protein